ncbi:cytochrome c peroxidase [Bradyrhizobium sp. S3.14.4]
MPFRPQSVTAGRSAYVGPPPSTTGQVWSVKQAVALMSEIQLGAKLSNEEENDIVAFLYSLIGRVPKIEYPTLITRTSTRPTPP